MVTVFSNVQADIADDLVTRFPQEFDFDAMLRRVCEDAGVAIDPMMDKSDDGNDNYLLLDKPSKYRLKGVWLSMEKAYKHLVTTLALYGSKLPEAFAEQENIHFEPVEEFADDDQDKDYNPRAKNILQDIFEDNKRQRRPRKSSRQNRKVIEDISDFPFEENDSTLQESKTKPEIIKSEDINCNAQEDGTMEEDGQTGIGATKSESTSLAMTQARRRGRPRKNVSPIHLSPSKLLKKRHSVKKSKTVTEIAEAAIDDSALTRKRGRPKLFGDKMPLDFPCSECAFVAKKRAKLRSHRLRMHLASPTKCDLCTKVFPNKRYMLRHRASHVEPQHCCDVCGKMYKIRKAMLEHRKTHETDFKKPKVKCEMCSKSFCNRYILECHIKDIHMGQKKSYLCSTCGKSFTTKHSLAEHTNAHTGVKPHICEHCGKSFSYESALRDHRFTHTDDKHFWCNHCQKGFSQRSGLKMHMRIHKQHKMFTCAECGRGFTQKQALQRHERVHKGEKPFVCKHCGRYFTDASIIRRHLILVHKINKDTSHWREDIVCTVKSDNEYQVKKVDEDGSLLDVDKEKNELFKVVSTQQRSTSKGPSRAFSRTYPRRVALLDDDGNVIAPPEMAPRPPPVSRSKSTESGSSNDHAKVLSTAVNTAALILNNENSSDLDSGSQVMGQRFIEGTQWEALANQVGRTETAHLEHIILDDTGQHEIHRDLEHVPGDLEHVTGVHKIIKYESLQSGSMQPSSLLAQPTHSPSSSPISFTSQSIAHSRVLETTFETLNPQAAHTVNQYYEGRSSNAPWSSMFYYSQLASQFGMSINPEYSYTSGNHGSSSTHIAQYAMPSGHPSGTTTLILQPQGHLDRPKPDEHCGQTGQGLLSAGLHSGQELVSHHSGLKLSPGDAVMHSSDLILQQDLSSGSEHHVTTLEHMAASLADSQSILVQHIRDSGEPSPSIPARNTLINLKHK